MDEGLLSPATRLGPVHLRVTDIPAALTVWRDTLGLVLVGGDDMTAELGAGGRTLIVLHAGAAFAPGGNGRGPRLADCHGWQRAFRARAAGRHRPFA